MVLAAKVLDNNQFVLLGAHETGKSAAMHPVVRHTHLVAPPRASFPRVSDRGSRIEDQLASCSPQRCSLGSPGIVMVRFRNFSLAKCCAVRKGLVLLDRPSHPYSLIERADEHHSSCLTAETYSPYILVTAQ